MKHNPRYILKHLSVRVPWHDNSWNGSVCNNPKANGACLILKNCALNRDDENEQANAGAEYKRRWEEKYNWYLENEIIPFYDGGGKNGTLIVTEDKSYQVEDGSIRGAISVKEIDEIIQKVFKI